MKNKIIAITIFTLMLLGYLYSLSFQVTHTVADGAYTSLNRLNNFVGRHDLLFIQKYDKDYYETVTPLKYFYNLNTFAISNVDDINNMISDNLNYFNSQYQNIYLLSDHIQLDNTAWLQQVATIPYQQGTFKRAPRFPPKIFHYDQINFYLYRVNLEFFRHALFQHSGLLVLKNNIAHLKNFNTDNTWSKGCSQLIGLNYQLPHHSQQLVINLLGQRQGWQTPKHLNLKVSANNQILILKKVGDLNYQFTLPSSLQRLDTLTICVTPMIPKKLGINNDPRTIGLTIKAILIR